MQNSEMLISSPLLQASPLLSGSIVDEYRDLVEFPPAFDLAAKKPVKPQKKDSGAPQCESGKQCASGAPQCKPKPTVRRDSGAPQCESGRVCESGAPQCKPKPTPPKKRAEGWMDLPRA